MMKLKLLNLNICGGKFYDDIISFVKTGDFDILCLQEIKAGKHGFTNGDTFKKLREDLGMDGEFALTTNLLGDKSSYDGNAIFYKKGFQVANRQTIELFPFSEVLPNQTIFNSYPRNALSLDFSIGNKIFSIINTQLAWNIKPIETPTQTEVGRKLFNFVSAFKNDYILTGDFNLEADSNVVRQFGKIAKNLTLENKITNTLNPKTHRAKDLFPKGLAVDFIFTTPNIRVNDFKLVDKPDLSDHFGLTLSFEL
jgi:endonuclease/exonuclease/phosphatase family metal-dependent hydrolase